jgi:hypothetical protein
MNTARDRVPIGPALPSAFLMRRVPCWGLGRGLRDVQPRLGISAGHDNRKIPGLVRGPVVVDRKAVEL